MITNGSETLQNKKPLSLRGIRAVIFDMDDLMIDSHPIHMQVFDAVLNKYGVSLNDPNNPFTKEEEVSLFGRKIIDIFGFFHKKYKLPNSITLDEMNDAFNQLLIPIFEQHVQPMPGIIELLDSFKARRYKIVLASSAKRTKIDVVLKKLGLANGFDAIVSGEDEIQRGKPAPDIFLKAAEKVGVKPEECLVLEDAKNGVEAAKAAGMRSVGVHNQFTNRRLGLRQDLNVADLQVNSLDELRTYLFSSS